MVVGHLKFEQSWGEETEAVELKESIDASENHRGKGKSLPSLLREIENSWKNSKRTSPNTDASKTDNQI